MRQLHILGIIDHADVLVLQEHSQLASFTDEAVCQFSTKYLQALIDRK